jgi:hypothetical protein
MGSVHSGGTSFSRHQGMEPAGGTMLQTIAQRGVAHLLDKNHDALIAKLSISCKNETFLRKFIASRKLDSEPS